MFSHGRAVRVWENLRQILASLRRRWRSSVEARRVEKKRARFWAEVRAGRREAEARSRS
jgi:hypothetical protein